jgi:hypothetical protein
VRANASNPLARSRFSDAQIAVASRWQAGRIVLLLPRSATTRQSNRLRSEGIDCVLDQYESSPPEGWPLWMDREIDKAQFVLMVCTEVYYRRVMGEERPGIGHGIAWEGNLICNHIYGAASRNTKFIPVIFEEGQAIYIPMSIQGATRYCLSTPFGYEQLYSRLIGRAPTEKPPLGKRQALPPREVKTAFFGQVPVRATLEMVVHRNQSILAGMRKFHDERVAIIRTAGAPTVMLEGGKMLVMHVAPFCTVYQTRAPSFDRICNSPSSFRPIGFEGLQPKFRINFDGLIIGSNAAGLREPQRAYVYVLPSGMLEAVACRLGRGSRQSALELPELQRMIIKYSLIYVTSLHAFAIEMPMAVLVSLIGVKGMRLLHGRIRF